MAPHKIPHYSLDNPEIRVNVLDSLIHVMTCKIKYSLADVCLNTVKRVCYIIGKVFKFIFLLQLWNYAFNRLQNTWIHWFCVHLLSQGCFQASDWSYDDGLVTHKYLNAIRRPNADRQRRYARLGPSYHSRQIKQTPLTVVKQFLKGDFLPYNTSRTAAC